MEEQGCFNESKIDKQEQVSQRSKTVENMDFHHKVRLIGYYNKPNQTMGDEQEYEEEAIQLAQLLAVSFCSLNKKVDPVFRSILHGNTVFLLKSEENELFAYYPYKNIARITKVVYNKKYITPIPYDYKSWFIPGDEIWVKERSDERKPPKIIKPQQYTVTTAGSDFLITIQGKHTLPLNWSKNTYISIKDLSTLIADSWVYLSEYETEKECGDCDGYDYSNCDYSRCKGDCETCGGRRYICNNSCFNHRYKKALKIGLNWEKINEELNPLFDILSRVMQPNDPQDTHLLAEYSKPLQTAYSHCKYLSQYFPASTNSLGKFVKRMNYCEKLNKAREDIHNKTLLTLYIGSLKVFCVNRDDVRCANHALFWKKYHIETIRKTYNLINDSFVSFDYKLKFSTKDKRNEFVKLFESQNINKIYLKGDQNEKQFVGYI